MPRRGWRRWGWPVLFMATFVVLVASTRLWEALLGFLFPQETRLLYPGASLPVLVGEHLRLVAISSGLTVLVGVPLGVWVTRRSGRDFLPVVASLTTFGQTFPPVAVLALAMPVLGFGAVPTIVALLLYGLLPVTRNTIAGLGSIPASILDAASGMGMSRMQTLFRVEMPLAAPVVLAGIRTSVIINIGTATVGAVIGSGGLGAPIIAGLVQGNTAWVIEGAVPAALLAVLTDHLLNSAAATFAYPTDKDRRQAAW